MSGVNEIRSEPAFLHDNWGPSLDALLSPTRGARSPHPFYVKDAARRADVIAFLRSQSTNKK